MPSSRRFLATDRNRVAEAGVTVTPSSTKPVSGSILPPRISRAGVSNGRAVLSGTYTGAANTLIEVEVLDSDVSDENLVSSPIKQGAGTSQLANITATGLNAQDFTVELVDIGAIAKKAGADIDGIKLRLKATGDAGNDWTATVDRTNTGGSLGGLTFTQTNFSLLRDLAAGTTEIRGSEYDFQAVVIGQDGQVPATAKRIAFGEDRSIVVAQWRSFEAGEWVYHFEPAIPRTIPAGTRIFDVTGAIAVTFSNGVTNELITDIVTRYDLAKKLRENSANIDVTSVVAFDRAPGGLALRDIRFRTDAHGEPSTGEGSRFATGFTNVVVGANASTELVRAVCYAISSNDAKGAGIGNEFWKLSGSVTGVNLANLKSGDRYTHPGGKFAVTIPRKLPEGFGEQPKGDISAVVELAARETEPTDGFSVCIEKLTAGINARDGTYTFIYTQRKTGDCACEEQPWIGNLNPDCLGIDIEEELVSLNDYRYGDRLVELNNWAQAFIDDQTTSANIAVHSDAEDIELCNIIKNHFYDGLRAIFEDDTAVLDDEYSAWQAATAYAIGDTIFDTTFYYRATTAGTSGGSPPTFPTTLGGTVNDNGVVWKCIQKLPLALWDQYFGDAQTDLAVFSGVGLPAFINDWLAGSGYAVGRLIAPGNGHYYRLTWADLTSTAAGWWDVEPTWGTAGGVTLETDSGGRRRAWQDMGTYTGDSTQLTDDSPVGGVSHDLTTWAGQYESQMSDVIAAARLDPGKKAGASRLRSACWQDRGNQFRWESQEGFLWADTNEPYYTAKRAENEDGNDIVLDLMEFGFYINVPCPDQLIEGDSFTITISGAAFAATYQVGDALVLSTIAAQPLQFAGGQTGDNISTWLVSGSDVGPLAPWLLNPDSPTTFSNGGLSMDYVKGGLADAVGSRFLFSIVGGHYQWRQDGGSWTGPAIISATPAALVDGLTLSWLQGAAPFIEDGDAFVWTVKQPFAAANVLTPTVAIWQPSGAGTHTITFNFGSAKTFSAVGIAFSAGDLGTVALRAGPDGVAWPFSQVITVSGGIGVALFTQQTYQYVQLQLSSAGADAEVGYFWVGDPLSTAVDLDVEIEYAWLDIAAGDVNASVESIGEAVNAVLTWPNGALTQADRDNVVTMIRALKAGGSWPFLFLPNDQRPSEAYLLRAIESRFPSAEIISNREYPSTRERRYGLELRCEGWAQ